MIRVPTEANTLKSSLAVCRFYSNSVDSGKPKHLRLTRLSFRTAALRRTCGVSLQSTATDLLVVPPFRLSGVYSQAFPVAAATIWNALPDSVVSASSVYSFRYQLKNCSDGPSVVITFVDIVQISITVAYIQKYWLIEWLIMYSNNFA